MKKTKISALILLAAMKLIPNHLMAQDWNGGGGLSPDLWRDGNVGIGLFNPPVYKLDVDNGDFNIGSSFGVRIGGIYGLRRSGATDFLIGDGGNVGIGINPTYKLDVDGAINIPSTASYKIDGYDFLTYKGVSNILLGKGIGYTFSSTAWGNIFMGDGAGGNVIDQSFNNVIIGHESGMAASPSIFRANNTFVGNRAGSWNNGVNNTFMGYGAGQDNTGRDNTFIGTESGYNFTAATSNVNYSVFLGEGTGTNITSGNSLTLLGRNSLSADGLTNATAIGANAVVNQSNSLILGKNALVGIGNSAPQYTLHLTGAQRTEWTTLIGEQDLGFGQFLDLGGEGRLTVNSFKPTYAFNGYDATPYPGFMANTAGLFISHAGGNRSRGVYGVARVYNDQESPAYAIGVEGSAHAGCGTKGVGVEGTAFNNSLNVGLVGFGGTSNELRCEGTVNVGVYGEAGTYPVGATSYDYAAYNNGTVNVTGNIYSLSDEKFKRDIKGYDETVTNNFLKLRPVSYQYKTAEYPEIKLDQNLSFGFIAQEVENLFPNLVKNNLHPTFDEKSRSDITYKSINYVSLIPVITHVLQEEIKKNEKLQLEVNNLKQTIEGMSGANNTNKLGTSADNMKSVGILYQNAPNPFKENTSIDYLVSTEAKQAKILVFNMNGTLLKTYELKAFGRSSLTIAGNEFNPGMFIYSLIVDGKEIDSKRMIILE